MQQNVLLSAFILIVFWRLPVSAGFSSSLLHKYRYSIIAETQRKMETDDKIEFDPLVTIIIEEIIH